MDEGTNKIQCLLVPLPELTWDQIENIARSEIDNTEMVNMIKVKREADIMVMRRDLVLRIAGARVACRQYTLTMDSIDNDIRLVIYRDPSDPNKLRIKS